MNTFIKVLFAHCLLQVGSPLSASVQNNEDFRIVQTNQGPVKGYRAPEWDLFIYYSIPYATAPTGIDRFKAPLPGPIWTEPFEAVDRGIMCQQTKPQSTFFKSIGKREQENCLIATVYTPDGTQKNLPVLVMFHGGAFQVGSGDAVTPKHLVRTKKVVAVTFNYRLGAHGFLCLGTPSAPGNAGMKDQVALLRWVKNNIANFGGDPNNVTIAGGSAGAASVALLKLSKIARGLFHKASIESAASIAPWSIQLDPIGHARKFIETYFKERGEEHKLGDLGDIRVLERFYTTAPYEVLFKDLIHVLNVNDLLMVPCIEKDLGQEIFLDDSPINILMRGDINTVPTLWGFAKEEGLIRVGDFDRIKDDMDRKFFDYIPQNLEFESEEEKEKVSKEIKEFYFGNRTVSESFSDYINYFTDIMFSFPTLREIPLHVAAGNDKIFLYEYNFPQEQRHNIPGTTEKIRGSKHCAQSDAVYDSDTPDLSEADLPEDFQKMKGIMREYWLNLFVTGVPSHPESTLSQWPATDANRTPCMELTLTPTLHGEILPLRARFWDAIYDKYYRAPVPPGQPPVSSPVASKTPRSTEVTLRSLQLVVFAIFFIIL